MTSALSLEFGGLAAELKNYALPYLKKQGILSSFDPAYEDLFWVHPRYPKTRPEGHPKDHSFSSWNALGYELSKYIKGNLWPGEASLTWAKASQALWMTGPERQRDIQEAQQIVAFLTGEQKLPHSLGGLARFLLSWLGVEEPRHQGGERLLEGIRWHHQGCTPCTVPRALLFDVKAYHASLLARMPSPLITIFGENEIAFRPLPKKQRERWREIVSCLYAHKGLRNAFIGAMAGQSISGRPSVYYNDGKAHYRRFRGILRPAALLIIRTAYELCAEAVEETRALYSNQDCVIVPDGTNPPSAWDRFGLQVELRASGEAEICSVGVYRVGTKATKWYEAGSRTQIPSQAVTVSGPQFARWLDRVKI